MTAIALLNPERDPHLVSDSMLSRHTNQMPSARTIWLPARGDVEAVQREGPDGWRISAFVRKTVYLPNSGGVFAWSGDQPQAVEFWKSLSARFLALTQYDPEARLTSRHLVQSYEETVDCFRKEGIPVSLSVLGYVLDGKEVAPISFGNVRTLQTTQFGNCLLAGTGSDCLEDCILQKDGHRSNALAVGSAGPSATEDLAQYISSRLLFLETLKSGYPDYLIPTNRYSGGYFEWHKIEPGGVSHSPPHLDFHIRVDEKRTTITRIFFSEMMYRPGQAKRPEPIRLVFLFNDQEIEIPQAHTGGMLKLEFACVKGAVLYQGLSDSADYRNPDGTGDIAGRLDRDGLIYLYGVKQAITSARTFIIDKTRPDTTVRARAHFSPRGKVALATLAFKRDVLTLDLSMQLVSQGPRRIVPA